MNEHVRTAIVTGSSRGIGAEIARKLSKDDFQVVVNYSGSEEQAQSVVDDIKKKGGVACAIQADVSDITSVKRLFDETEKQFVSVDILVNNAGVLSMDALADVSKDIIHQHVDTNLKGVMFTTQQAVNRLNQGGRIVNISTSIVGLKLEKYGVYAATKAGVEALTAITSKELRGKDITVNAVAPGPTDTELFMKGKSEDFVEKLKNMAPLERLGTPEDIANVVAFLCSENGIWINGQVIRANGGIV